MNFQTDYRIIMTSEELSNQGLRKHAGNSLINVNSLVYNPGYNDCVLTAKTEARMLQKKKPTTLCHTDDCKENWLYSKYFL